MTMQVTTPVATFRCTFVVVDNWYELRDATGRLLMVGTYLPAPAEGITSTRIDPDVARALMDELRVRSLGPAEVGRMEMEGAL